MNFNQKTKPNTTIKVADRLIPTVGISGKALNQMFIYTKEVADEVGWLGTAYKTSENTYYIDQTFLFDQEVHATTTEITTEGLTKFAEELLAQDGGMELWNDIKMWGHSHVNMPTNPSGQDDKQMNEFANIGHDFFIRLICNKKGELRIDVYDYKSGLTFLNVEWDAHYEESTEEAFVSSKLKAMQEEMDALNKQLDEFRKLKTEEFEAPIKEEIKAKVKKFVYAKPKAVKSTGTIVYNQYYNDSLYSINDDVELEDYFAETEILELVNNCHTRAQFDAVMRELGMSTYVSYANTTKLYSKLVQLRFMGGTI